MSHHTAPGKGGFFELENDEELLLTPDMIPTPPKHLMADNPYPHHDKRYKRWKSCAIGRYYKKMYKELVRAKNKEDFLLKAGNARNALTDPSLWNNYMEERELDVKRPVGRPYLSDTEKVKRAPTAKRSDKMKLLLEDHGFTVEDGFVYNDMGNRWIFLLNGKVELKDGNRVSAHSFLQSHS